MVGYHPRELILLVSRSFLGVPFGLSVFQTNSPSNPTTSAIVSASSLIDMSSPVPTLICSA